MKVINNIYESAQIKDIDIGTFFLYLGQLYMLTEANYLDKDFWAWDFEYECLKDFDENDEILILNVGKIEIGEGKIKLN